MRHGPVAQAEVGGSKGEVTGNDGLRAGIFQLVDALGHDADEQVVAVLRDDSPEVHADKGQRQIVIIPQKIIVLDALCIEGIAKDGIYPAPLQGLDGSIAVRVLLHTHIGIRLIT